MNSIFQSPQAEAFDLTPVSHPFTELVYCREGRGEITIEGKVYKIGPGDIACIPAGAVHSDRAIEPRVNVIVTYTPDAFHDHTLTEVTLVHDRGGAFLTLLDLALDAQQRDSAHMRAYLYSLRQAMFNYVRYWGAFTRGAFSDAVGGVNKAILWNFDDPDFNLAAEIEKTGYCISHFRRIFKAAYGRPPQQQLLHVRIEYAKLQMRLYRGAYPVKRLCQEAGFRDPCYFSRMFRQLEGCSPSEYLARCAREQEGI